MPVNVVTPSNLGNEFELNAAEQKIHLLVDWDTVFRDPGSDQIFAIDRLTSITFDPVTKRLSYVNENGATTVINLLQINVPRTNISANNGAPGGVIPSTIGGIPADYYFDFDGNFSPSITLPVPVYTGQTIILSHQATFNSTIQTTNTGMAAPLVMNNARRYVEFVAIDGRWFPRTN